MKILIIIFSLSAFFQIAYATTKEMALTFDDAPMGSTQHFETNIRTETLIKKLKDLSVPPVMIFANACKRVDAVSVVQQLKKYRDSGNLIENHTCSHLRLDDVGFEQFTKDIEKGDQLLTDLSKGTKFFRFPYLNESKDSHLRNELREWLKKKNYKNALVSVDDDDYLFSFKVNQAKQKGKKIDYPKIEALFLKHLLGAVDFYDDLAIKTIGRSPKHVMLLHEMDITVMFIDSLVKELRKRGWKIISAEEAYQDILYSELPANTYSGDGLIAQLALEKTGKKSNYDQFDHIKLELNRILGLEEPTLVRHKSHK